MSPPPTHTGWRNGKVLLFHHLLPPLLPLVSPQINKLLIRFSPSSFAPPLPYFCVVWRLYLGGLSVRPLGKHQAPWQRVNKFINSEGALPEISTHGWPGSKIRSTCTECKNFDKKLHWNLSLKVANENDQQKKQTKGNSGCAAKVARVSR